MANMTIQKSGAEAGVWSSDWKAVKALAKENGKYYLILFCKSSGCAYCSQAKDRIWSQKAFLKWAKDNGIGLLYADRVIPQMEPGNSVKKLFPDLKYYPTLLLIDGTKDKVTAVSKIVFRYGAKSRGKKIILTVPNAIEIIENNAEGCCEEPC